MQGLCLALLAATPATPPQEAGTFPDPSLLGGVGGVLFALHVCTWLLCSSFGRLTTTGANVVAHFVATLFGFGALAATGVYGWVIHPPAESLSRTRGIHFPGEVATNLMTAFQIYEVTLALLVPVLRGKHYEMLVHHIMTLSLAILGGYYQYLSYYASFFFGLTELSSLPLTMVDLTKYFRSLPGKIPIIHEVSRTAFALLFLALRVVYWPFVSYDFWAASFVEWTAPTVPRFVIVAFCVSNVLLTGLQLFWGSLIVKALVKKIRGDPSLKDD